MSGANGLASGCAAVIDATGLNCPLPLLKTKKALAALKVGERVYMCATAAQSLRDLTAYAREAGHTLVCAEERDHVFHFVLEKAH